MFSGSRWMIPAITLACQTTPVSADVLTDWNEKTVAFVTPRMVPAAGQRVVAMMQVAMFDAINSIDRSYRPYLVQLPAAPTTSKEAAAATAAGTHRLSRSASASRGGAEGRYDGLSGLASRQRGEKRRDQARRGDRFKTPSRACQRRRGCPGFISAAHNSRRLCADRNHGLVDLAQSDAVCDDQPVSISAVSAGRAHDEQWAKRQASALFPGRSSDHPLGLSHRIRERPRHEAKIGLKVDSHMLRHACGYALAKRHRHPNAAGLSRPSLHQFDHALCGAGPGSVQKHLG
jgi:hypothetical protein